MKEDQMMARLFLMKKGKMTEIVIRTPKKGDMQEAWKFYNRVIKETNFLSAYRPLSKKNEEKWLKTTLDDMEKKKSIHLFAESD